MEADKPGEEASGESPLHRMVIWRVEGRFG